MLLTVIKDNALRRRQRDLPCPVQAALRLLDQFLVLLRQIDQKPYRHIGITSALMLIQI